MQHFRSCLIALSLATSVGAVERLPIEAVNLDALISETQKEVNQPNGFGLVWFMPETVFVRLLSDGGQIPRNQLAEVRSLLKGKCVVAIVRAHVSSFGTFAFFDESTVRRGTKITIQKPSLEPIPMHQLDDIPPDLTLILNVMKPVLANALGPMGKNIHFYVFKNTAPDGTRIYDPYKDEKVHISFAKMGRLPATKATYDTICDSLFKPRLCKNGKRAHVTWKYDPWSGEKLPE